MNNALISTIATFPTVLVILECGIVVCATIKIYIKYLTVVAYLTPWS